jgi:hypothetical protein
MLLVTSADSAFLLGSPKGLAAVAKFLDSSNAFVKTSTKPAPVHLPEATLDGW